MDQRSSGQPARLSIVVDASGGDSAPAEPVAGVVSAARRFSDTTMLLVGQEEAIGAELDKIHSCPSNVQVVPASETIGMDESPVRALRAKKDSSISVGVGLVVSGRAQAFVSAGNTGAVVAASSLRLGLLDGVQRPGIAVPLKALDQTVIVIDVGANIHCKPMHLMQYGVMAAVFARDVLELPDPRVGLLNVGEEDRKGTALHKEAFDLLSGAALNFVGNVEAQKIFSGGCDIVVCEGFVGNVMLKTCEGVAMKLLDYLGRMTHKSLLRRIGFAMFKDTFAAIKHCGDYAEYGGAPLLGVKGVTIIAHGRSDARAIENAVREARSFIRRKVNDNIAEAIRDVIP